jgi:dUTP pyrophosphatase
MSVTLLHTNARAPTKSSRGAAGYDLYAARGCVIGVGERHLVSTELRVECPVGTYARIAPRSGLALKHGLDVMAGVVDRDYTGTVGVVLINLGSRPYVVEVGDRIAQLIFKQYRDPGSLHIRYNDDEDEGGEGGGGGGGEESTDRDPSGFGSSGR